MKTRQDVERLRARAADYRRQAARAQNRAQLRLYRALATHLEEEARELGGFESNRGRRASQDAG
jgi:hypothetical protein